MAHRPLHHRATSKRVCWLGIRPASNLARSRRSLMRPISRSALWRMRSKYWPIFPGGFL